MAADPLARLTPVERKAIDAGRTLGRRQAEHLTREANVLEPADIEAGLAALAALDELADGLEGLRAATLARRDEILADLVLDGPHTFATVGAIIGVSKQRAQQLARVATDRRRRN